MISGFETPTSGSISIAGESMEDVPPNLRPTNMVFQSYAIFPHLNVAENVGYGLKKLKLSSDEIEGRINEALELVDLKAMELGRLTPCRGPKTTSSVSKSSDNATKSIATR